MLFVPSIAHIRSREKTKRQTYLEHITPGMDTITQSTTENHLILLQSSSHSVEMKMAFQIKYGFHTYCCRYIWDDFLSCISVSISLSLLHSSSSDLHIIVVDWCGEPLVLCRCHLLLACTTCITRNSRFETKYNNKNSHHSTNVPKHSQ